MTSREELVALWNEVTARLEAAFALLPAKPLAGEDGGAVPAYRELLDHNELELALDELEALGIANAVDGEFWRLLLAAAQVMRLERRAERLSSRVDQRTATTRT